MKSLRILAAAIGLAAAPAVQAAEVTEPIAETMQYRAYLGGLPLGTLHLKIAMDREGYATEAQFDMTALLRVILDTDAKASSNGRWQGGRVKPESFDYWVRDRKKRRTTVMHFSEAGDPVEVVANPPFDDKPYDMSIDKARGALDPASAAVKMAAPRDSACGLNLTVFDGKKLHGITLSPVAKKAKGNGVYCTGRYERLAGFKAKHMRDGERSYEFVAELRPNGPNRWRPVKVWAPTKFGVATAVLQ